MMPDLQTGSTRIAILSSAGGGGGGIAAKRMADTLSLRPGIAAEFLSGEYFGGFLPTEVAPMKSLSNGKLTDTHYTLEYPGYQRNWMVDFLAAHDVVNVHWASYLLGLAELDALARRGTRLLFMLHDFHYITGGCHYPAGCTGMTRGCLNCPQFDETQGDINLVPVNLRIKQTLFARPNVHLAAPSQWLRDQAVNSGIVPASRAHVLRNPYIPQEPRSERPEDGVLRILVIADSLTERRKGMPMALEALNRLAARAAEALPGRQIAVHIVGHAEPGLKAAMDRCRLPHHLHGRITEHQKLVDIFAICDLVLTCSTEDNWPNILVESGAYGCVPVVGPGHGCEEFVQTYGLGGVARGYSAEAFADALVAVLGALPDAGVRADYMARIRADHETGGIADAFLSIAHRIPQMVSPR